MYHIPCDSCDVSCIRKTERLLKSTVLEHKRPRYTTSKVSQDIHIDNPEHQVDMDGVKILAFKRGVREAIHVRMDQYSLNKDGGRYNLPSIWNNVLRSRARGPAPRTDDQSGSWLASS